MLPTSGLFKDIDCPYYDNYCGRPYCHFRHRKRSQDPTEDSQDGEMATAEFPTYKPTPKSQLAQVKSHIPISYVPDTVIRPERISRMPPMYNFTEKVTYKPTPLSELSKNNAINTVNLLASDLYKIGDDKIDEIAIDKLEPKNNEHCDIDFEELSTEFDMIDDIINENPCVEDQRHNVKLEKESKTVLKKNENSANITKSSDKNKSSKDSSKNSTSKSKDDKSKTSSKSRSSSSSSTSNHKSSSHHKSKSDKHRSRSSSKERRSKERSSDSKHKDNKKDEKKPKSSSNSSSSSREKRETDSRSSSKDKDHKNKDSKKNSTTSSSTSSSKHKEYDKSKRKEKEKDGSNSSKEKHRKQAKSSSNKNSKSSNKEAKQEPAKCDLSEEELENRDLDEDLFAENLEEECYRIFNEYKPEIVSKPAEVVCDSNPRPQEQQQVEEYVPTSKKRIAHVGADQFVSKVNHVKSKPAGQNAALQMASRYKVARDAHMQEENDIVAALNKHGTKRQTLMLESYQNMKRAKLKHRTSSDDEKVQLDNSVKQQQQGPSLVDDIINGKSSTLTELTYKPTPISKLTSEEVRSKPKKIAPAMNVSSIQQAKARIAELAKKKESLPKTPVQTLGKGIKRVAHVPDTSLAELPDVLQPDSKKIPVNVRTRYLTMIADECVKLYLARDDAYSRAVNEEFKVMERCAAILTYRNSAMLAVNRIRKEIQERESKGLGPIASGESGASSAVSQFKGKRFYENILTYLLKEDELEEHGYPREGPIPGKAVVKCSKQMPRVNLDDNQRLCCRCFKVYLIDDRGFPFYKDECIYHPLKKRTLKGERMYLCCKSTEDSGCVTSNTHVSESEETDLLGFQTTMDPSSDDDPRSSAVYALDCEMCYTTKGLELTRVTIIDPECKTVYESLVKPLNPIIDYNTQFSGITKEQMDRTSTSILQVQANILHLCNSDTILIGHSLESDMKALKIVHSCVVDTSILFPHRMGLPHKRALRVLASEYLNKIIQSDVAGHDSAEDAITCMELVIWKLKEDLKVKGVK